MPHYSAALSVADTALFRTLITRYCSPLLSVLASFQVFIDWAAGGVRNSTGMAIHLLGISFAVLIYIFFITQRRKKRRFIINVTIYWGTALWLLQIE